MTRVVSNPNDLVVLVDSKDEVIGLRDKRSTHEGRGILHRAISAFLFNDNNELLLQKRHLDKPLWGGFWSNSCCTHPYFKETPIEAASRRVREELGLQVELEFIYKFEYRAVWEGEFCEHELCHVFVGNTSNEPNCNPTEVLDWQWISVQNLNQAIQSEDMNLTPWLLLEWEELQKRGFPK